MSSRSSTDPDTAAAVSGNADELILVGRVRRSHGVRGAVLVESLTDNPARFAAGSRLRLRGPAVGDGLGGDDDFLTVDHSQEHGGGLMVWFEGIGDREAADGLRGSELAVAEDEVPPLQEDGVWLEFQLVGCRVHDAKAGDLGEVRNLAEDGGGLLLVVDDGLRSLPIPFVREFLVEVDVAAKRIEVSLPEGLIEACAG